MAYLGDVMIRDGKEFRVCYIPSKRILILRWPHKSFCLVVETRDSTGTDPTWETISEWTS